MENRIYFRQGGKFMIWQCLNLRLKYGSIGWKAVSFICFIWGVWFRVGEHFCGYAKSYEKPRKTELRGKSFISWKCRDVSSYIYCSLKFNKYGRFISVITVNGLDRTIIIIPVMTAGDLLLQKLVALLIEVQEHKRLHTNLWRGNELQRCFTQKQMEFRRKGCWKQQTGGLSFIFIHYWQQSSL